MVYGNTAVMLTVIAVVLCVLGIAFAGMYCLNRAVDRGEAGPNG
jgi:hypothetical protein